MYRVVKMTGTYYAIEIDNVEDDEGNINEFLSTREVVILCEDLNDLDYLGIEIDEIKIVEND